MTREPLWTTVYCYCGTLSRLAFYDKNSYKKALWRWAVNILKSISEQTSNLHLVVYAKYGL